MYNGSALARLQSAACDWTSESSEEVKQEVGNELRLRTGALLPWALPVRFIHSQTVDRPEQSTMFV